MSKSRHAEQPTIPMYPLPREAGTPRGAAAQPTAESPTELWIPVPKPAPPRRRHWLLRIVVGLAILVFLAIATLIIGGGVLLYESSWLLPGVSVLGIDLGGRSQAEAVTTLQNNWQSRTITLAAADHTWNVPPETLGISLDVEATVAAAYRQGRSWGSLRQGLRYGLRFPVVPVWELDVEAARANLGALTNELQVQPVDAGMELVNGRFAATPATSGQALDLEATLRSLQLQAAAAVLNGRFDLITTTIAPTVTDVSGVVEQANGLLGTAVAVRVFDAVSDDSWTWTLTPDIWGQWLTFDAAAAQQGQFTWTLDAAQVGAHLNAQVTQLGGSRYVDEAMAGTAVSQAIASQNPNVSLRAYHYPQQHVVQSGETISSIGRDYGIPYPWIQQANPGVDSLFAGQILTIPSVDELIPLPVVENKRVVVSITQQKAWVYENGSLKWEWAASTGIADSPTSPGIFQIQTHEETAYAGNWDLWMPSFMGIYRPVPTSDFMNGFHGFPSRNGSQLLWTSSLGHPVTYGCILLSSDNAQILYDWAEEGVIVEIQP
ncbi:MAG: L,D-transpeptidase family protein [Ardenticatenaceae bacterium]|nr:L,D-transpeptidase family protein [Ardenticatenaceae bacterium]